MRRVEAADVCVVGAGPAGCVIAARLAQLGFAVCLLERASFPRRRLGESLSPGVLPLLETIGARRPIEAAGFTRIRRVSSNWTDSPTERIDPNEQGLLVDRGRFDALLMKRARAFGVTVLQPAVLRQRSYGHEGWHLVVATNGTSHRLRPRLVVDAAGRGGILPGRRRRTGPRTVALYAYWKGRRLPAQPRIESAANAWCWGVPLPDGTYNTLAFVGGADLRGRTSASRDLYFHELIACSGLMAGCEMPRIAAGVFLADATPHLDEASITSAQIKVGDAALAIDPLSSSGVQKAVQTALSGAIVVNTLLRKEEYAAAAMRFYRDALVQASDRHRAWARMHYATVSARLDNPFWAERAGTDPHTITTVPEASPAEICARIASNVTVHLSAETEIIDVPRLDADFVGCGPALRHPSLEAPVAYLGGWEIAPLLREMRAGTSVLELIRSWSSRLPFDTGVAIAGWMLARGILVSRGEPASAGRPTILSPSRS